MANRKGQTTARDGSEGFKEYLEYNGNTAGLEYIYAQEQLGHKLTIKGGGVMRYYVMESVIGYDVFASDENKQHYASILQSSTSLATGALTLCYNVVAGSAHVLVKADDEETADGYIASVNRLFEERYDDGKGSVGYPFRLAIQSQNVNGTRGLWNAIFKMLGYCPIDVQSYPYSAYPFLMQGNSLANLVLGVELKLIDVNDFRMEILEHVSYRPYVGSYAPEKFSLVFEELKKRYVYPYARVREDLLAMVIGETCARCRVRYVTVAKKMKLYKKRHDLTVTTLCSFIIRRKSSFDEATSLLGLGSENPTNLLIETLAEINRLTGYSYEYIVKEMMRVGDQGYSLLVTTFCHLHEAYGWSFPELCEKFHVVKDAIYIGSKCGF